MNAFTTAQAFLKDILLAKKSGPTLALLLAIGVGGFASASPYSRIPVHTSVAATESATTPNYHVAVPAYFDPGDDAADWLKVTNNAPVVGLAIINPNNGPSEAQSQDYVETTKASQNKGIQVIGYVHTLSGAIPASVVMRDVDKYYDWYQVNGIFIDEASNDCAEAQYYIDLYNDIKLKDPKAIVVLNPGTNVPECYDKAADIFMDFESSYVEYKAWHPSSDWETNLSPTRVWHIIHTTSESDLPAAIALAKQNHAGWIYVTSKTENEDTYGVLPPDTYWNTLIKQVSN